MIKRLIAVACIATAVYFGSQAMDNEPQYYTIETTVEVGETVWDAVARVASNHDNMQDTVDRALRDSGISDAGNVQPGSRLIVKVKPLK